MRRREHLDGSRDQEKPADEGEALERRTPTWRDRTVSPGPTTRERHREQLQRCVGHQREPAAVCRDHRCEPGSREHDHGSSRVDCHADPSHSAADKMRKRDQRRTHQLVSSDDCAVLAGGAGELRGDRQASPCTSGEPVSDSTQCTERHRCDGAAVAAAPVCHGTAVNRETRHPDGVRRKLMRLDVPSWAKVFRATARSTVLTRKETEFEETRSPLTSVTVAVVRTRSERI